MSQLTNNEQVAPFEEVSPKILLADDEPDTLTLTSFYLQKAGFQVVVAGNGQEALEKARIENPALAILDRMMPEMDGLEACRKLRLLNPDMYIILLTAMGSEADRLAGWEAGADDYLVKPFNLKELTFKVKAMLRHNRTDPASLRGLQTEKLAARTIAPAKATPKDEPKETTRSDGETDRLDSSEARKLQAFLLKASRAAQTDPPDLPRARELYLQALMLDPDNPTALKWLAYRTHDPHEGCRYLERLLVVQPDNTKARRLLEAGRLRCRELDQQAYFNILSQLKAVQVPEELSTPPKLPKPPIGQLLMEKGYISRENIETATTLQEMFNRAGAPRKLGEILVDYGCLTEEQLQRVLEQQEKM